MIMYVPLSNSLMVVVFDNSANVRSGAQSVLFSVKLIKSGNETGRT